MFRWFSVRIHRSESSQSFKMRKNLIYLVVIITMTILLTASRCEAASEPVCTYRNSEDETIFIKYLPLLKRGQDYVDFGKDGKCVAKAVCTDTFKTVVEECSQQKINCANKDRFTGVFPGCCIKCR